MYGDNLALMGGFAEYAVAAESALVAKPAELSFVQASTIPQAGAIAVKGTARAHRRTGAGQRRRWRLRRLRDPARQEGRRPRHGGGQRHEAGLHAVRRSRRGRRLPGRGLHAHHPAVRPRPGPGRAPLGVRVPACARPRWRLPMRRRVRPLPAAHPHGRLARRPPHRPLARRAGRAAGAVVLHPARRSVRAAARCRSTSTAPTDSTRWPTRSRTSAKGGPWGRLSSRFPCDPLISSELEVALSLA